MSRMAGGEAGWSTVVRGRRLVLLRVLWAAVVTLCVVLYILSIPLQIQSYQLICPAHATCNNQITVAELPQFQRAGLSLAFYARYITALISLAAAVWLAVALVIFWRRSDDWMAIFCSLVLVVFGINFSGPLGVWGLAYPALRPLVMGLNILSGVMITAFFYLFPDGRFVPRWLAWLVPPVAVRETVSVLVPSNQLAAYLLYAELASVLAAMIYRFVRVSDRVQRQQTKWVVFGTSVAVLGFATLITVAGLIVPDGAFPAPAYLAAVSALYCFMALIPLSIGMAMVRSHLWDIDIIIRRTLVYTLLTAVLALIYGGSVVVSQGILRSVTGQAGSILATVVSTLGIAALFQPMRRRIQTGIDRRFFRGKYDAARVLGAFGVAVRDEVDLARLTEHLVAAVDQAMQPTHMSLWLARADAQQVQSLADQAE